MSDVSTITETAPVVSAEIAPKTPVAKKVVKAKSKRATPSLANTGVKGLSATALKEQIKELLEDLKASTDGEEKKRIRRKLRLRGHFGGLGEVTKPAPKKVVKKAMPVTAA